MKFLKSIFGSGSSDKPDEKERVEYNGYQIQPCPKTASNGWTTEAIISKEKDGETLTHHLIRADQTPGRDGAVDLSIRKARTMIDQVGDRVFER